MRCHLSETQIPDVFCSAGWNVEQNLHSKKAPHMRPRFAKTDQYRAQVMFCQWPCQLCMHLNLKYRNLLCLGFASWIGASPHRSVQQESVLYITVWRSSCSQPNGKAHIRVLLQSPCEVCGLLSDRQTCGIGWSQVKSLSRTPLHVPFAMLQESQA